MARPRRSGPTRSIFMTTVVDQVKPWLIPSRTLAAITQPQTGAQISSNGTGRPMSQPATRTGLRPYRSDSVPEARLLRALVMPKAAMNISDAVKAPTAKTWPAKSGKTVRSWPTMPPTRALTATRRENWARLARSPSLTGRAIVAELIGQCSRTGRSPWPGHGHFRTQLTDHIGPPARAGSGPWQRVRRVGPSQSPTRREARRHDPRASRAR